MREGIDSADGVRLPFRAASLSGRVGRALSVLDRFVRLHFVGFTAMWGLLGAFSSDPGLGPVPVIALTALGISFHLFGGVFNDLIDLPIDRTQPLRADDALVTGSVSVRGAALLVAVQVPVMASITIALGGSGAFAWLLAALVAMTIYNLFGKRCRWPWVPDAAQGFAWFSLTYLGASVAGGSNTVTAFIALSGVLYILLVNGIHGGLRDLENDRAHAAATMALWLGIMPLDDGTVVVPRRASWYCCGVLGLLCAVSVGMAWSGGHRGAAFWAVALLLGSTSFALFRMMRIVLQPSHAGWSKLLRLHTALLLAPLLIAALSLMPPGAAAYVLVLFAAPLMLLEVSREVLRLPSLAPPHDHRYG